MLRKNPVCRIWSFFVCIGLVLMFVGCASSPPANVKSVTCETKKIEWEVAPEAEIVDFGCTLGTHENDPAVIYTVTVKNVTDKPQRYRLNIFLLDMDKAYGALIPAKGKPPVLAPGAQETVKIPFIKSSEISGKTLVRVVPMSSE